MKWILRLAVVLVVVVVLVAVGAYLFLNQIVQRTVESAGTAATGTATTLEGVNLSPLSGALSLNRFAIANPQGFSPQPLFNLSSADVQVEPLSVIGEEIVVPRLHIDGAEVLVEYRDGKLNVMEMLKHLQGEETETTPEEPADPDAAATKVVIRDVAITNTKVRGQISIPGLDTPLKVDTVIADIRKQDIGSDGSGVTAKDAITILMETVLANAAQGVKGVAPNLDEFVDGATAQVEARIDETAKKVEGKLDEASKKVDETLGNIERGLGGLLGGKRTEAGDEAE